MIKLKLTIDEQVEHMKNEKGIKFNIVNEEEAKRFLEDNNYYFKLKSYAKNYEKYNGGKNNNKYINLEFAYLQEISTLDMYFRRFTLKMTLDIEHHLKTKMLRDCSRNDRENGYEIIEDLYNKYPFIKDNVENKDRNSACSDLVLKYKDSFAIWNIVEVLSFGDFTKLYDMYYNKYKTEGSMEKYLWSVRFLRNADAHNSCLLNSLRIPYSKGINPNKSVMNLISKVNSIPRESRQSKMKNPIIHDFIVSLYVFNNIVTSEGIKKNRMDELKYLVDNRMIKHKEYFQDNQLIIAYYKFIKSSLTIFTL